MRERYETARFVLRALEERDVDALYQNLSDPVLMKFYDMKPVSTREEAEHVLLMWRRAETRGTGFRWAVALRDTDRLIGTIGLHAIDRIAGCAEIGCEVSREYWRCGVMLETLPVLLGYGFRLLLLDNIKALIAPGNEPSIALARKFGFRDEGVLRDCGAVHGRRSDMVSLSMSREEYEASLGRAVDAAAPSSRTPDLVESFVI